MTLIFAVLSLLMLSAFIGIFKFSGKPLGYLCMFVVASLIFGGIYKIIDGKRVIRYAQAVGHVSQIGKNMLEWYRHNPKDTIALGQESFLHGQKEFKDSFHNPMKFEFDLPHVHITSYGENGTTGGDKYDQDIIVVLNITTDELTVKAWMGWDHSHEGESLDQK
ncbi:MAG: hypothetical protein MK193_05600 [Lentisphaeria bacterium]|nr:hypothetical protein [Lentisphaeria bacterium]